MAATARRRARTSENQNEMMLVRVHPITKAKAPKLRRYTYRGVRYDLERGWYEVPRELAEELKKLNQDHYDPDSPPAFDVATVDEAKTIDENEAKRIERASAMRPNVTRAEARRRARQGSGGAMTTRDLARMRAAREEDPDPDGDELLDPDDNADVDDLNDPGLAKNVGRRQAKAGSGPQPVPPDESHDGDKGVHNYANVKPAPKDEKRSNLPPPDESHDGDKGVHHYMNRDSALSPAAQSGTPDHPTQTAEDKETTHGGRSRTRK